MKTLLSFFVASLLILSASVQTAVSQDGADGLAYESYHDINLRWGDYQKTMEGLDRDAWRVKFNEFFIDISWDHIHNICLVEDCEDKDIGREIADLIKARMQVEPPSIDELLMFISDQSLCSTCLGPFIRRVAMNKEEYLNSDVAQPFGQAILDLAENHTGFGPEVLELEQLAVELWSDETTMAKMMAYCTSTHLDTYIHGATMLSYSRDPAATDSLEVIVGKWIEGIYTIEAFSVAMRGLARRVGPDAYYTIDPVYRSERSEQTRQEAFGALMLTQNPRIYGMLLDKYLELDPGVEAVTHLLPSGPKRQAYYDLWNTVSTTEPGMIPILKSGDSVDADNVIEILDRQTQFASPKDRNGLIEALEAYLVVSAADNRERVQTLITRIENWRKGIRP